MRRRLTLLVTVVVLVSSITAGAGQVAAGGSQATTDERVSVGDAILDLEDGKTRIASNETYFVGMTLYRDEGVPTDAVLNVVELNGNKTEIRAQVESDLGSVVTFETDDLNLSPGTYALETEGGERVVRFHLARQEFDVEWDRSGADNEGRNSYADLTADSNRENYTILLTAQIRQGYEILSGEELRELLNGTGTPRDLDDDGTKETLAVERNASTNLTFDFRNTTSGEFDLTARVPDTGTTSSASLEVGTSDADVDASEADATFRDNSTYYKSQLVYRTEDIEPGMTLEIVDTKAGREVVDGEIDADYDGELALDTDRLTIGTYELRYPNGTRLLGFTLLEHTVGVHSSRSNATNGAVNSTAAIGIDSNRPVSTMYLRATRNGETVDATTLSSVVGDRGKRLDRDGDGVKETLAIGDGRSVTSEVNFQGVFPGVYEFTVSSPDTDATGSTVVNVSDSIGLNEPGTPNASHLVTVSLGSEDDEIAVNDSTTVMVTLNRTRDGVRIHQLSVSADDNGTAAIENVSSVTGEGVMRTNIVEDGATGQVRVVDEAIEGNRSDVELIAVTVTGESPGTVNISANIATIVNRDFDSYVIADVEDATLEVVPETSEGVDVTDDGNRSTSLDEDRLHEDTNGDGELTVVDVQILFEAIVSGDPTVTENTELFDFNGDGTLAISDVQVLFAELS